MSKTVKLVVCNEPEHCEALKEAESRVTVAEAEAARLKQELKDAKAQARVDLQHRIAYGEARNKAVSKGEEWRLRWVEEESLRKELQMWVERFASLGEEDAGETPEIIFEAVEEKLLDVETRLSEAEKLLVELRECGEGMQRDLAFAKTRKRQSKRSISLLEILILNHNDVTERLAKALRGADPAKFDPVALLKSLNGEDLHALLEATALITDPLGQFLIKKAAEEPTSCGDCPGVVLGALDACPKGYKECWKTQTPLPALKTEANGE